MQDSVTEYNVYYTCQKIKEINKQEHNVAVHTDALTA